MYFSTLDAVTKSFSQHISDGLESTDFVQYGENGVL